MWLLQRILEMVRDDATALVKKRDLESFLRLIFYFSLFVFIFFLVYSGEPEPGIPPLSPII